MMATAAASRRFLKRGAEAEPEVPDVDDYIMGIEEPAMFQADEGGAAVDAVAAGGLQLAHEPAGPSARQASHACMHAFVHYTTQ